MTDLTPSGYRWRVAEPNWNPNFGMPSWSHAADSIRGGSPGYYEVEALFTGPQLAHIAALQALADELATFLTDEEHGSDGMSGDDGASNLGAFIQQARGLSDKRPRSHAEDCECGDCPERA